MISTSASHEVLHQSHEVCTANSHQALIHNAFHRHKLHFNLSAHQMEKDY